MPEKPLTKAKANEHAVTWRRGIVQRAVGLQRHGHEGERRSIPGRRGARAVSIPARARSAAAAVAAPPCGRRQGEAEPPVVHVHLLLPRPAHTERREMRSEEDGRGQEPTMEFLMMMILLLFQRKTSFWTRERLFLASKQEKQERQLEWC